jgi:hypothetical protein
MGSGATVNCTYLRNVTSNGRYWFKHWHRLALNAVRAFSPMMVWHCDSRRARSPSSYSMIASRSASVRPRI